MQLHNSALAAGIFAVLAATASCGKSPPKPEQAPTAEPSIAEAAPRSPKTNGGTDEGSEEPEDPAGINTKSAAAVLSSELEAEVPTSHSAAVIAAVAGASDAQLHAVVVLGRRHLRLNGKVVARMRCTRGSSPCAVGQLAGPVDLTAIDIRPDELEAASGEVVIAGLRKAAAGLRSVPVAVVADKRVRLSALLRTIDTLHSVGARPIVAAVNREGRVVLVGRQGGDPLRPTARASDVKGLPDEVVAVVLQVGGGETEAILRPTVGELVRNKLHGDRTTVVRRWAESMAQAYPGRERIELRLDPDAAVADVIPLLDLLRDECGAESTLGECRKRTRRFSVVHLALREETVAEAPLKVEPPTAPANAISAEMLRGIGAERARMMPHVAVPHELLQPRGMPTAILGKMPSRPPEVRPNIGGPAAGP